MNKGVLTIVAVQIIFHQRQGHFNAERPGDDIVPRIVRIIEIAIVDEGDAGEYLPLISLNLYAGISSDFNDIRKVRFHYQQAQCALSFQGQGKRRERLFFFRDYTFHYMMMNSSGIFPAEYLCPPGLLQLRKYDEGSNVDYWNTLRCYLDEQMNVSQTAKILSIHRNTLLQRIERIYSVLGTDLSDPMLRFDAEMTMP